MDRSASLSQILFIAAGLIVWLLRFLIAVGLNGLACSQGWTGPAQFGLPGVTVGILAITVVAILAAGLIVLAGVRRAIATASEESRFVGALTALVAGLAILAMIWETLPIALTPMCA